MMTIKCTYCDEPLDDEEAESPRKDRSGDVMCDECYHEHFEFICCWCENYGDEEDQHNLLVVFDAETAFGPRDRRQGYGVGVYRITGSPYYGSNYLSMWFFTQHLERIADVPSDADGNGYACGHLCLDCQRQLQTEIEADESVTYRIADRVKKTLKEGGQL